jgi:glycosyltransferase involved in cell wall biosynthesis
MPLKILITTFTYPPNADGVAEATAVLAQGLARQGHAVTVATEFHPQRKPNAPDANPRVEQFKITGNSNWRIGIRGETDAYQKFLRNFSGDLVVFENWDVWCTHLAVPCLEQIKAKKVLVSHGYVSHIWKRHRKFPWGLGQWMGGWPSLLKTPFLMRKFHQVVFLSQRRDWGRFFDHRIARWTGFKRFSIIPNGAFAREFNDDTLPDFRRDFGIGPGLMILCVAQYCDGKNQLLAVRAFRRAKLADATLVLIGNEFNDYTEQVRRRDDELQKEFPAGRVVWPEKLNRKQICAAYRAADLFILPSKTEAQPIVLLEAMASHTPWLSTDVGCVSELPGGIVVRTEDEMVNRLHELAGSTTRRQKLAAEGWAASQETYDWEQVVAAYQQLITKLCAEGQVAAS